MLEKLDAVSAQYVHSHQPGVDRWKSPKRVKYLSGKILRFLLSGRAPGPMLTEEEPIIPDGSVIPLNLDPPGGEVST